MIVDADYIEDRAAELYEEIHPVKLFQDESVDRGTQVQRVMITNDELMPGMVGEDEAVPRTDMTYEEKDVEIRFLGAGYDKHVSTQRGQGAALRSFDEQFVNSFTDAIHKEITSDVDTEPLDYDTPNGILFEAMLDGQMKLLERTHAEPDTMLVADSTADNILDDSVFEEWEPIAEDIEQEFGIDVHHDQFNALYGNEVLLVDSSRFGVQYHAHDLFVQDRFDTIQAGMKGGFTITDPDAGIRLTV